MSRFAPSRLYLIAAAVALGLAAFSGWCATNWLPAGIPAVLFLLSAGLVLYLAFQPIIEITPETLSIGAMEFRWSEIRRVDQTGWVAPLVAHLTLADGRKVRLLYPGDAESANRLLVLIQQKASLALINGVPWRRIFGDPEAAAQSPMPAPKYRVLNDDDEADVERLYQQLRTAGRFNDPEK